MRRPAVPQPLKSFSTLMVFSCSALLCSALLLILPGHFLAPTALVAVRDPKNVALARREVRSLVGMAALPDVTLQAGASLDANFHWE
jgi:hypothetical protein